jgi:hypothetical protein
MSRIHSTTLARADSAASWAFASFGQILADFINVFRQILADPRRTMPSFRSQSSDTPHKHPKNKSGLQTFLAKLFCKAKQCISAHDVAAQGSRESYYSEYIAAKKKAEIEARVLQWMHSSPTPPDMLPLNTESAPVAPETEARIFDSNDSEFSPDPFGLLDVNGGKRRYIFRRKYSKLSRPLLLNVDDELNQENKRQDLGIESKQKNNVKQALTKASATIPCEKRPPHGVSRSSGRWRPIISQTTTPAA